MPLKYQILTRFNHVHVKRHGRWSETMKIDFKTSNIVIQYVSKKMMLIWRRVVIVSCCVNCQGVINVILSIKSSVSGERCIRYYTVVSLAIGKINAYRLSKVLHESVAWNLLRYVIFIVQPIIMRSQELQGISNHRQLDCLLNSYVTRPQFMEFDQFLRTWIYVFKPLSPKCNKKYGQGGAVQTSFRK